MPRTKKYKSKEEAIEAWNTWAGKRTIVTREAFNALNDNRKYDYPFKENRLVLPPGEKAFGELIIDENAGYIHPWPRLYLTYTSKENEQFFPDDMFKIYKMRVRWRLINKDHKKLKEELKEILLKNDRNNTSLNDRLRKWNKVVVNSGCPEFLDNDLRGIDLSGLNISSNDCKKIFLRNIDLKYSELHLLKIKNGYIYNSNFMGSNGVQLDLKEATCQNNDFSYLYAPASIFNGSDFSGSNFSFALITNCIFDGCNLSNVNFENANLFNSSILKYELVKDDNKLTIVPKLKNVIVNKDTKVNNLKIDDDTLIMSKEMFKLVSIERESSSPIEKSIMSSVEIKPGFFGISLDLKRLLGGFIKRFKKRKKRV